MSSVQYLIQASTKACTLIVRIEVLAWSVQLYTYVWLIVDRLNRVLNVKGRMEGDGSLDRLVQDWVWEDNGKSLRWKGV
jgi:hypothetical protein